MLEANLTVERASQLRHGRCESSAFCGCWMTGCRTLPYIFVCEPRHNIGKSIPLTESWHLEPPSREAFSRLPYYQLSYVQNATFERVTDVQTTRQVRCQMFNDRNHHVQSTSLTYMHTTRSITLITLNRLVLFSSAEQNRNVSCSFARWNL